MNDITADSIVQGLASRRQQALPPVIGNIAEDPEKAAQSLDLANLTGSPATSIYNDFDEFQRQHKATMASDIVSNNPHLQDFVQRNPIIPKLINDDYGNLDTVSQKVSAMSLPEKILRAPERLGQMMFPGDPLTRFKEGGPLGSWLQTEDIKNYPFASAVAAGLGTPLELFLRGAQGVIMTGADAAANVAGRDIGGLIEAEAMGLTGRGHMGPPQAEPVAPRAHQMDVGAQVSPKVDPAIVDSMKRAMLYVENGREPPKSILPEYDQYLAQENVKDLDALKEATTDAQSSLLRERSPDLFRDFIAQHTDAEISISGDAVAKLYGDKIPTPDDGILGWVPGISDKLALAHATGDDVKVPLADWLAKSEPELMQALHDDIRVRPGGVTANEAKLDTEASAIKPPPIPISEPVPMTRAAAALEPMLSIGDRKLRMEKREAIAQDTIGDFRGGAIPADQWRLLDENGNKVGHLELTPAGSDLMVDLVMGLGGLGPRDFGPALMRSLLHEIKQNYPEAKRIGGYRISGAREKAGSESVAWIKLDNPKGWDTVETANEFRRILEGGQWETFSPRMQAYIKPDFARAEEDRKLIDIVNQELGRIVSQKVGYMAADRIAATGGHGQEPGKPFEPSGVYIRYSNAYPIILYALEGPDPLGTARHEAIHHLRNYGFFNKAEWAVLEKTANEQGWIAKFGIDRQYVKGDHSIKLEESIAEAYREWARGTPAPTPEIHGLFERMKAFFTAIKDRISALLGKEATWEDIFAQVHTGEVGSREGTKPLDARAFDEKLSVEPPSENSWVYERAAALGVTKDFYKRYDQLIQEGYKQDLEAATKRAMEERGREQTQKWREDRKALRVEVAADIRQRPDVAADLFFGSQELYGKKVPLADVRLDASALSERQKALLPPEYYGKNGLHPDDVANLFGYGSGDAMVERLSQLTSARKMAEMSAKDFTNRLIDIETDRQMRVKYGVLENNILDAVKEQVTSEVHQERLYMELQKFAEENGVTLKDKATTKQELLDALAKMPLSSVSSDAYLRAAGTAGRKIESGLLKEKPQEAFGAKLQQYHATVLANEMTKVEKEIARFDKDTRKFIRDRQIDSMDQQYTNFIHEILGKVGRPTRSRSIQDIATEIGAGEYKTLQDFVQGKNTFYLREVAVAPFLFDTTFRKDFDALTVDEFRAVKTSVDSMIHNGRDEKKIEKAGIAADLKQVKGEMLNQLEQFDQKKFDAKGGRRMGLLGPENAAWLRSFGIDHLQMETIFNRFDQGDPNGVFQQYVMRPLIEGANSESAQRKAYAKRLLDIADDADLKKDVDNTIFKVPGTDQLMKLNRGNLRAVMMDMGNPSNLRKRAEGYGLMPEQVVQWVHQHATKEDWVWAQKLGDIFADLKLGSDKMYRNLSGVASESIRIDPIQTPFGTFPGWYYPLIAHPEFEGTSPKLFLKNALEQEGFIRATTANGYTKSRTGAVYPLAMDLDMMPFRIGQMIHDIELRPAVVNASKIFYDKDVRTAIATRFGNEWRDMMEPYLIDVANSANYTSKAQKRMNSWSEFIRQNLITTLVGLNPGTFLKHTPTALVQSIHEVGANDFLQAMRGLWTVNERTGESNWQFAMKSSEELQRRHSHFQETLGGAADELIPTSGFRSLRATVNYYASYPVAMGDLASAVPTWLAQYTKSLGEGLEHGDAVYMADRAVRRAHGSTAITNRSTVMRGGSYSPWLASVYGFFNHIMNRQYEMIWKSGEAIDAVKETGDKVQAMKDAQKTTANLWAYVLAPAIVEELVAPLTNDEHESWGVKAAKGLTFTLGASWIGVRDLANAVLHARDPSLGLATTALKSVTDPMRDMLKDKPLSKAHAGKVIKDTASLVGTSTGLLPAQVGRVAEFGFNVGVGIDKPKGPWGWLTGMRYGTIDKHPRTFQEWQRHHFGGH